MSIFTSKTISAAIWNFTGNTGYQIIRFGIGIVLARILTPRDYGLVGMLAIFISLSDALIDSGFSQALIQKQHISNKDYSSVFFLNIIIAVILYSLLFVFAPYISDFFAEPQLSVLTKILGISLIIRSFIIVQQTIYIKNIDFRFLTKIQIISVLCSGMIAIPMAISGYGVWSLVFLTLTHDLSRMILLWFSNQWRPSWHFSYNSLKQFFGFGSKIMVVGILDNLFIHSYKLIIGKVYNAAEVGFYSRADGYKSIISKNILNVINSVSFPSFSLIQNQPDKMLIYYKKAAELSAFLTAPLLFWMLFTAEPFIRFLITDKWIDATPLLQILCIGGLYYPLYGLQVNILKALGKSGLYLKLQVFNKLLIILGIIIGLRWDVIGLAFSQTIVMIIQFSIGIPIIFNHIKYPILAQVIDSHKYIFNALICFLTSYWIINNFTNNDFLILLLEFIIGSTLFVSVALLLKFSAYKTFLAILKNKIIPRLSNNNRPLGK